MTNEKPDYVMLHDGQDYRYRALRPQTVALIKLCGKLSEAEILGLIELASHTFGVEREVTNG